MIASLTIQKIKQAAGLLLLIVGTVLAVLTGINYRSFHRVQMYRHQQSVRLEKLNADINEAQLAIDRYEKEQQEFQTYLFNEQDIPAFLEGVSQFALQSGVNILDMKTKTFAQVALKGGTIENKKMKGKASKAQEETPQQKFKKMLTLAAMPINFKVEGTYPAFVAFLGFLEDFQQLLSISNVEIVSGKEYPILKCGFTLKIYSIKTLEELQYK